MTKKKERLYLFDYNFQNIYLFCVLLTMFFVAITGVIYLGCGFEFIGDFEALADAIVGSGFLKFFILMWVWMVLHEIIHGVSYILYGAKAKDIKYGVALEKGILYCKCGEYVDKTNICWSILNPFIYIGIVTLFLGFAFESVMLVALSIVNISGACADIAVWGFFVGRNKDMKFKEIKDSSTFILKTTEDLTNKKFFAVKLVEELEEDNFKENDKIITITRGSKVVLGFMAVIVILYIILGLI